MLTRLQKTLRYNAGLGSFQWHTMSDVTTEIETGTIRGCSHIYPLHAPVATFMFGCPGQHSFLVFIDSINKHTGIKFVFVFLWSMIGCFRFLIAHPGHEMAWFWAPVLTMVWYQLVDNMFVLDLLYCAVNWVNWHQGTIILQPFLAYHDTGELL